MSQQVFRKAKMSIASAMIYLDNEMLDRRERTGKNIPYLNRKEGANGYSGYGRRDSIPTLELRCAASNNNTKSNISGQCREWNTHENAALREVTHGSYQRFFDTRCPFAQGAQTISMQRRDNDI